jgi:hypothetical protein
MARRKRSVRRPYERVKADVKNHGDARSDEQIRGIVLHTTEGWDRPGISDLEGLADFFDRVPASSHVAVDGEGQSARFVRDGFSAWTQAAYNPQMLSIEQIGFARWSRPYWNKHRRAQFRKTAKYIAYWSKEYNIPIRKGKVENGRVTKAGIFRHSELGAKGGGHSDPGKGYPLHTVLNMARYYKRYGW